MQRIRHFPQNFYAFNFVLPTGDMYSQIDNLVRFYKPDGECAC
jgi:hypothetical protein